MLYFTLFPSNFNRLNAFCSAKITNANYKICFFIQNHQILSPKYFLSVVKVADMQQRNTNIHLQSSMHRRSHMYQVINTFVCAKFD